MDLAEPSLVVHSDPKHMKVRPGAVLARVHGGGDPSRYVRKGDVVLDLGSAGGRTCFLASQVVGAEGRVIGVDPDEEMVALARRSAPMVGERIGYANVEFRRGRVQDLAQDLDALDAWLGAHPVRNAHDRAGLADYEARQRREAPMIADASIDVVVSNGALDLVDDAARAQLIREIFRVLKVGGRIALSDVVSAEVVEHELLRLLEEAGFHGIAIDAVTVTAHKGEQGGCREANQSIIYLGPWKRVEDDDGHVFRRGQRVAVCARTFHLLTSAPFVGQTIGIQPLNAR